MTAAHVLNRCPSKRLNLMVPEEAWSGNKPSVKHFIIFGSLCYRHVPDQKKMKKLGGEAKEVPTVTYVAY